MSLVLVIINKILFKYYYLIVVLFFASNLKY